MLAGRLLRGGQRLHLGQSRRGMPLDEEGNKFPYPAARESRDLTLNDGRDFFRPELREVSGQSLLKVSDKECLVDLDHKTACARRRQRSTGT